MTEPAPVRRARAHPLTRPFPLAVLTLATFLVIFTFLVASLRAHSGTLAPAGVPHTIVSARGKRLVVTTTPSGRVVSSGSQVASQGAPGTQAAAAHVVTSSSGAGFRDD